MNVSGRGVLGLEARPDPFSKPSILCPTVGSALISLEGEQIHSEGPPTLARRARRRRQDAFGSLERGRHIDPEE